MILATTARLSNHPVVGHRAVAPRLHTHGTPSFTRFRQPRGCGSRG